MQLRSILTIMTICTAVLVAGYTLTRLDSQAAAAPAPAVSRSISAQATSVEEVQARNVQPLTTKNSTFVDNLFGYRISYPADWSKITLSSSVVIFQSADNATRVKVEAAGPLPADGLAGFVDRSLGSDILLTRQLLTIHDLPAERVQVYSDTVAGQVTNFYINADDTVYRISGVGQQKQIESVARSFNAPQLLALK